MSKKIVFLMTGLIISAAFFVNIQPAGAAITPTITVTSPNGGEQWVKGKNYSITWTIANDNLIGNDISLHLSKVNDTSFSYTLNLPTVLKSTGAGTYSFDWKIPDFLDLRNDYKVGVVLAGSGGIQSFSDQSDSTFNIVAPENSFITLTSPNGGESLEIGKTYQLKWTGDNGTLVGFQLLSEDGKIGYSTITGNLPQSTANDGTENWTVSSVNPGKYRLKMFCDGNAYDNPGSCNTNSNFFDISDASFSIVASITVTSPNGGEQWQLGNNYVVNWQSNGVNNITVRLSTEAGSIKDFIMSGNPGTYNLHVPADFSLGNAKLYVMDTNNNSIFGMPANGYLKIVAAVIPSITVLSPNGGEQYSVGTKQTVKWKSAGSINGIMLHLTNDAGAVVSTNLVNVSGNPGSADWIVPSLAGFTSKGYKVLIQGCSAVNCNVNGTISGNTLVASDMSDATFNIVETGAPSITVLSPNGGESFLLGNPISVSWKYSNLVESVAAYLIPSGNLSVACFIGSAPVNNTSASFPISSQTLCTGNMYLTPGSYILSLFVTNSGGMVVKDSSDAAFSIVAASATPTPTPIPTPTPTPTSVLNICLPDNTLIKMPDDPKVYVIIDCQKKWIQTADEFKQEGYKWTDVKEVNSPVVQAYSDYQQVATNLLKAIGQERVYKVVNNKLLWVPTISAFNAQGLKWSDVQSVDTTQLNQYQRVKLVQAIGDEKVYYITESGLKRHIPNETVFNSYSNKWEDVVTVDVAVVNSYPDANLIKAEDGYQVYKLENGQKRWIKTDAAFRRLKLDWNKVVPVNSAELAAYPDGPVIE